MTDKCKIRLDLLEKRREYTKGKDVAFCITREFIGFFEEILATLRHKPPCVFCYVGSGWEVPTRDILNYLLEKGVRLLVPRCGDKGEMSSVEIKNLDELIVGKYGLWEPSPNALSVAPNEIDLCVVPATAFDTEGYRIGRGGGYYDRFIPLLSQSCVTVGLIYSDFLLPHIPRDEHDRRVGQIITEHGLTCSNRKG